MFINLVLRISMSVSLSALILVLFISCVTTGSQSGDGLVLRYGNPGEIVSYSIDETTKQKMTIPNRTVEFDIKQEIRFTSEYKGTDEGTELKTKIDTIYMVLNTPGKVTTPDMSGIVGKYFNMKLSPTGVESDYDDLENLVYELQGEGEKNISSAFQALFSDMPEKPVKPGDSWNTADTIIEKTPRGEVKIIAENVNVLEGIEDFMGVECAKISKKFKGTITGNSRFETQQTKDTLAAMVIELKTTGSVEGRSTIYFDFKRGLVMEELSEGISKARIVFSGEQATEIPLERKMKTRLRIITD